MTTATSTRAFDDSTRFDRAHFDLEFEEVFAAPHLDDTRWVAHYLPHWTTPDRSAARYDLDDDFLRLRIDVDQPAWRPEDGELRVSNIQSGAWSGPIGSPHGQHRHIRDLQVRTPQETRRLYTPEHGAVEAILRASTDPTTMLAFWLIGFEQDAGEESGEICVVELFGNAIAPEASNINVGVKAHHDTRLTDDMVAPRLSIDASEWHTYTAAWNAEQVHFYVDDALVYSVNQGFTYPMQLMIDLFEFPTNVRRDAANYPKTGDVKAVRGYRPRS